MSAPCLTLPHRKRPASAVAFALAILFASGAGADEPPPPFSEYDAIFSARIVPTEKAAHVALEIKQPRALVETMSFRIDPTRHLDFTGDGEVVVNESNVTWQVPKRGGTLRWTLRIDHLRHKSSYDARAASNWALFRGDDLIPPARVVTEDGAHSKSRLRIKAQKGWNILAPFPKASDGSYIVERDDRRFDRPTGWILAGKLGVTKATLEGCKITIAGPVGQRVRRLDQLALLRWSMPTLHSLLGELPSSILIVGADDPMLRGGLSGPGSLYLHSDRPLIDRDGTSPLLHEMMHVVMGARAGPDGDWIVEGLAELYSLELLVRSRSISKSRRRLSIERFAKRAKKAPQLAGGESSGAVTARAVVVLDALDQEIRTRSEGQASLDDVLRALTRTRIDLNTANFQEVAQSATGLDLTTFFENLKAAEATRPARAKKPDSDASPGQ